MNKHQRHRAVRDRYLRQGLAEVFTPGRHYATYLAEKVIKFSKLRGEKLGRLQKLAIHRIHGEQVFDLHDGVTAYSDQEVVAAYFQFFDELFFFGSLGASKRCIFKYGRRHNADVGKRGKFVRFVRDGQDGSPEQVYEIVIFSQRHDIRYLRFLESLCFLLQGMCHAFLGLWRCKTGHCNEMWDDHGTGYAWQEMALAIEVALADPAFLGLHIPLDRVEMLAENLDAYPTDLTDEELRRWGIKPDQLARMRRKS